MLTVFNDCNNLIFCIVFFPENAYLLELFDQFLWECVSLNCRKRAIPCLTAMVFECSPNTVHFPDVS